MVKIKAIWPFWYKGKRVEKDAIVDVDDEYGTLLLSTGTAEPADEATRARFTRFSHTEGVFPPSANGPNWIKDWQK